MGTARRLVPGGGQEKLKEIQRDGDDLVEWLIAEHIIQQYSEEENEAVKILMALDDMDVDDDNSLRELVEENDNSTPYDDLVRNTGHKLMRTTLIHGTDLAGIDTTNPDTEEVESLIETLVNRSDGTLDPDTAGQLIFNLLENCGIEVLHEGCSLDVLWYGDIELAARSNSAANVNGPGSGNLVFTRPTLLLIDYWNGRGDAVKTGPGVNGLGTKIIAVPETDQDKTILDSAGPGYGWDQIAGVRHSAYAPDDVSVIE